MKNHNAELSEKIIEYMLANCCGHRHPLPRQKIAKALGLDDRLLRRLCAKIPQIITNSKEKHIRLDFFRTITVRPGYYILPPYSTNSDIEYKIALIIIRELKSRAKELWERANQQEEFLKSKLNKQKWLTLNLTHL